MWFRLDQIIYDDDQGGEKIMAALKEKERLYKEHYAEVLRLAEENRKALFEKVQSDTGDLPPELIDQGFEYVTNYNQYDEARNAAQPYFDLLQKIRSAETSQQRTSGLSGGAGVAMRKNTSTQVDNSAYIDGLKSEAEQVFSDLEGMARFIVENANIVEIITPINEDVIAAEKEVLQAVTSLEQNLAKITREERRIKRRFKVDAQIEPGEVETNAEAFSNEIDEKLNIDQFRQIQIDIAINTGDWENSLLTLSTLEEKLKQLQSYKSGLSPDVEGYQMINSELSAIQTRISEINQQGNESIAVVPQEVQSMSDNIKMAENSMMQFQSTAQSASSIILDAFFNLAEGIEISVKSIMKSILKMVIGQLLASGISSLFSGGTSIAQGAINATAPVNSGMGNAFGFLPGNIDIPEMEGGGIFYGPSVIKVAEYGNANFDPEIVGKASQIRNILGVNQQSAQQPQEIALSAQISTDYIFLANQRSQTRRNIVE